MLVAGLILLLVGFLTGIPAVWTIGVVLVLVGLIVNLVPIGGTRRRWY